MSVLFATHPAYLEHLAGPHHPECPERLGAVIDGSRLAGVHEALIALEPRAATMEELERVHPRGYLERIAAISAAGGGRLDPDTYAGPHTWEAARLAAGAGLTAIDALRRGEGDAAFCAVRPPGHHATPSESMGFCVISNIAVVAAALADAGERVVIVDIDAHHGNGTQAAFYDDPRVLFISYHQWPLYPGTGRHDETGSGAATGTTVNLPLPPDATGDVYLTAFDEIIAPLVERFAPTWLLISAGFDAHRNDPITDLGLSAGDYAPLSRRILDLVPAGRRIAVLEGGYDLEALTLCSATMLSVMAGQVPATLETPTSGGPGLRHVQLIRDFWSLGGAS